MQGDGNMNKIVVVILCLSLVVVLVPIAITNPDISTYDPMADVNRDGIVDVNDLSRLGQAYGSTGLAYQENKTVITVFNETGPIENARVAVFSIAGYEDVGENPKNISYTDSFGIADFTLDANANYTVIVWSGADYNYADFTTNLVGEASVSILIGKGTKHLPTCWVTVSIINRTSGALVTDGMLPPPEYYILVGNVSSVESSILTSKTVWTSHSPGWVDDAFIAYHANGIAVFLKDNAHPIWEKMFSPNRVWSICLCQIGAPYLTAGVSICTLDENGNANVVMYID